MKSIIEIKNGVLEKCTVSPGEHSITVPAGVTRIERDTFFNCKDLTSITLPEGVTIIGDYAFDGCEALASIELPASVRLIGYHAFGRCEALTSIALPGGLAMIGEGAFDGCKALTSIEFPVRLAINAVFRPNNAFLCPETKCIRDLEEKKVRKALGIDQSVTGIVLRETVSRRAFVAWAVGKASEVPKEGVLSLINMRNVLCLIDSVIRRHQLGSQIMNSAEPEISDESKEKEGLEQRKPRYNLS